MHKFLGIFFVVVLLFFVTNSFAQIKLIDDNPSPQGMQLHADPRLAIVLKKRATGNGVGFIRSGKGFRVQIYNGNDRNKATATKIDFMRRFPDVQTYMTYVSPQFRVKVGDFRSRAEAYKMYEQVSEIFNPSMIVPDYIVINSAKNDQ